MLQSCRVDDNNLLGIHQNSGSGCDEHTYLGYTGCIVMTTGSPIHPMA